MTLATLTIEEMWLRNRFVAMLWTGTCASVKNKNKRNTENPTI